MIEEIVLMGYQDKKDLQLGKLHSGNQILGWMDSWFSDNEIKAAEVA